MIEKNSVRKKFDNKKHFAAAILFIASLFAPILSLHAQDKTFMTFVVIVERSEDVGLEGVTVKLFEKGATAGTIVTPKQGIASFKLKANTEYLIEMSKDGYVTKLVNINTKIPEYENQSFEVAFPVLLFQPCEGLDYSALRDPVVKLVYNDVKRDFLPEKVHDNVMRAKLEQLMKNNDKCIEEKYLSVVRKADRLFAEKRYLEAKDPYTVANGMRPDDKYVIKRLEEIEELLSKQKDDNKAYNDYIAQADKQFNAKNYPLAREFYRRAQGLKPSESYPPAQIAAIDALLAKKEKEEKEQKEKQLQQQQEQARLAQQAQLDQERKLQQEKEEQERKAKLAKEEQEKQAQLAKAEKEKKAQQDKEEQERKAKLAKEEQDRLAQAAKLEQEKKEKLEKEALEKKAQQDKEEQERKAKLAKEEQERLALLAKAEQEKKTQLAKEAQEKQDKENRYQQYIKQGDIAMPKDVCGVALQSYRDALAEKPNDAVALRKISEAEQKCKEEQAAAAKNKETREAYTKAIAEADKLLAANSLLPAKAAYESASKILPLETYPGQKIKEIDIALKNLEKEEQQQYKKLMSEANKAFDNENLPLAKELFNKILALRPNDQYSKEKIQAIDAIEAEQRRLAAEKKAKQAEYDKAVAQADAAFKDNRFTEAKAAYQQALQLLPTEAYPKQKLGEIDGIEKEQAAKIDREFNAKVQSGDRNFATKNYTQALQDYQDAQKIKPTETYPPQRIADVNKILSEQAKLAAEEKAKQESYNAAIKKADKLFSEKSYDQALVAYKEATSFRPEESYPYSKIDEINKAKKQLEIESAYQKAITTANSFFDQKKYEQSKAFYSQALELKANDAYATAQIAKADKEIAEQLKSLANAKARQDAFDKAIADAEKSFAAKDYEMAKTGYQTALAIFPDKPVPKQKIIDIDKILKEKRRNDDYRAIIDEANALYAANSYEQAKTKYKAAGVLKPEETFPGEKIKEIDRILAQQQADKQKQLQNEKNYNDAIKKANDLFDKGMYDVAKKEYERSLEFMPAETYPKQKIAKIDEINKMLAAQAKQPAAGQEKPKAEAKIGELKFKTDTEREAYLKQLLVKYPPGVTCEVYKEANRVVTRYIIVREDQANDFREIKYSWGTDYLRNDKPITLLYFNNQIRVREGEYFSKTEF